MRLKVSVIKQEWPTEEHRQCYKRFELILIYRAFLANLFDLAFNLIQFSTG